MNIINFLYHSGIINDDGGWDERPIWEQQDKLERFAELIVMACDKVVAEKYDETGFTEPWMYPGQLLEIFKVKKTEWD